MQKNRANLETLNFGAPLADKEHGASMLEFAIVIPLLVFFIISVVDIGQAIYTRSYLTQLAREGVRQASLLPGLEIGSAVNLQGGCGEVCLPNHAELHKRIAVLLTLSEETNMLRLNPDPPWNDPQFGEKQRIIFSERVNTSTGSNVTVTLRANFKAFFPTLDGVNLTASQTGPYLQ